jgi:hypothetical protein
MDLNTPIVSAIVSALVSFFVGIFFSDKAVERSQSRRRHSIALQKSLDRWINSIDNICIIPQNRQLAKYSHEKDKLLPISIDTIASVGVPHHKFLESHMASGNADIWAKWNDLLQQVKDYTEKTVQLAEDIRQQFLSQSHHLNLREYYYQIGHRKPGLYVAPDMIAKSVIEEIRNRIFFEDIENFGILG